MGTASLKTAKRGRASRTERKISAPRRTTVTLSLESQEIVERFRSANGSSTSAAIDQIILRSQPRPSRLKNVNGFLVLDLPGCGGKAHFTIEDVKRAEDEMDREYMERFARPERREKKNGRR